MKTMRYMLIAMMAIAVSFTTTSCDAEDGEDGIDGVDGQQGPQGIPGEDGNANVISSGWVEYDSANWSALENSFGNDIRRYPISDNQITEDIVDEGVVLVYTRFIITNTPVYTLPFTENITGGNQTLYFQINPSELAIIMKNSDGIGDPGTFGGSGIVEYRYVIIPSNVDTSGIDLSNFNEVSQHFGL